MAKLPVAGQAFSRETSFDDVDRLFVDTIRFLAVDAVERAQSGHPGLPLGAAPMAHVLFTRFLRHNPADPAWPDRDRFVLSAGHGSMLLYALLHLCGYDLALDELRRFRQWGSRTPGHPELGLTPGVEATTGPLGQGISNAVGMAIAERMLAHRFNRPGIEVVNHRTYALVSDGDLMEGVAQEAASLAGHLGLGKLICLYDSNDVSLDGPTSRAFTEDRGARLAACGWQVLRVEDGDHDLAAIAAAVDAGLRETARPTLIEVRTTIGFGSPHKAGTSAAHGAPLGAEEARLTKRALGWTEAEAFTVPDRARRRFRETAGRGAREQARWGEILAALEAAHPELAAEWYRRLYGDTPEGWEAALPSFEADQAQATRVAGGVCIQALAGRLPELVGGDADLSGSTNTRIRGDADFDAITGAGRNIAFGVREHAMGAISNGIAYHGGLRAYASTFFVFSDYMRPAIRLAALNHLPVVYVFTHDSVGLGEDGPTHQPVEHLAALRAVPNLRVIRPADANETSVAWELAVSRRDGPTALVLTRQKLPVLPAGVARPGARRGAYVLTDGSRAELDLILVATGSEVHVASSARRLLEERGLSVRLVSMPSWEVFDSQPAAYRAEVLVPHVSARLSVEAGVTMGWDRYLGPAGRALGIDRFGASAPGPRLFEEFGFTADAVARAALETLEPAGPGLTDGGTR
jgi:transketolase